MAEISSRRDSVADARRSTFARWHTSMTCFCPPSPDGRGSGRGVRGGAGEIEVEQPAQDLVVGEAGGPAVGGCHRLVQFASNLCPHPPRRRRVLPLPTGEGCPVLFGRLTERGEIGHRAYGLRPASVAALFGRWY